MRCNNYRGILLWLWYSIWSCCVRFGVVEDRSGERVRLKQGEAGVFELQSRNRLGRRISHGHVADVTHGVCTWKEPSGCTNCSKRTLLFTSHQRRRSLNYFYMYKLARRVRHAPPSSSLSRAISYPRNKPHR